MRSPLRLLFICPNLAAGGAERQWSILLPGLRERGIDARVIALDGAGAFLKPLQRAGVPVEVLWMRHQADLLPLWRSPTVRRFKPDAVVTRGVSGLYVGQAIATCRGAQLIYNDHRSPGLPTSRRRQAMARLISPKLDLVITVTPEQIEGWLNGRVPRERIAIVRNGLHSPEVGECRQAIRAELGLDDSDIVAMSVAGLRPEKRVPDFVRAALLARRSCHSLRGVIVGDGSERHAVEAAARRSPGIQLLGCRDDVPQLLAAADIFVLSSEFEAAPMAILEAMAARLPVVATRVGAISQFVLDGVTGLLVDPRSPETIAAKLLELAADPVRRRQMGEAGFSRFRSGWDAERMIDGYVETLSAHVGR